MYTNGKANCLTSGIDLTKTDKSRKDIIYYIKPQKQFKVGDNCYSSMGGTASLIIKLSGISPRKTALEKTLPLSVALL